MAKKRTTGKPKKTFEENLKRLEQIVESLESGELPLEDSIRKYEAGIAALKECYAILNDAEKKIETITQFDEEYFKLAARNRRAENELLATQQAAEELLIRLRGQMYRILPAATP